MSSVAFASLIVAAFEDAYPSGAARSAHSTGREVVRPPGLRSWDDRALASNALSVLLVISTASDRPCLLDYSLRLATEALRQRHACDPAAVDVFIGIIKKAFADFTAPTPSTMVVDCQGLPMEVALAKAALPLPVAIVGASDDIDPAILAGIEAKTADELLFGTVIDRWP